MVRVWILTLAFCLSLAPTSFAQQPAKSVNLLTNGSFEFWSQYGQERIGELDKYGPKVGGEPALLPVRWTWSQSKQVTLSRSTDAHGGKYAMAVKCEKGSPGARFDLGYLEVVPEASYTFGVWAKGSGDVEVSVIGRAAEGEQVLKQAKGTLRQAQGRAGGDWQEIAGTVEIPGHIRMVTLRVKVVNEIADVLLDDAYIAAPIDAAYDADAVLRDKQTRDEHTLLFADFDDQKETVRFNDKAHEGKCSYTDDKTGRFGRALRVGDPDMATIVFAPKQTPKEGTLELWVSPDRVPVMKKETWSKIENYLQVHSPNADLATLNSATNAAMNFSWRISEGTYDRSNAVSAHNNISLNRMRKGQWTHVAVTWDASAVRMYVDGVLADMQTQGPLPWFAAPSNLTIGSPSTNYNWDGMVDEIRISDIKRYGPFTPKGATPKPLPPAAAPPVAAPVAAEKPKVDLAAQRAKLIGKIEPTSNGEFETKPTSDPSAGSRQAGRYIYEATSAQNLIKDGPFTVELQKDKIVPGLTTMRVNGEALGWGTPEAVGVCWKLGDIKPGKYFIGVLSESQAMEGPPAEGWWNQFRGIYLNGRDIQCSSLSNPVQVAPGVWFAELQTGAAQNLKPGDVIAYAGRSLRGQRVARMVLHTQEPPRGPFKIGTNFGGQWWSLYTNLMLMSNAYFTDTRGGFLGSTKPWVDLEQNIDKVANLKHNAAGKPVATCQILNPLPVALTVEYQCTVRGYYRKVLGQDTATITVPAQSCLTREIPFDPTDDDPAYSVEAAVKAVKSGQFSILNPHSAVQLLGWPEGDTVEFFPFLRQTVPWVNPFEYRGLRRLNLTTPIAGPRPRYVLDGPWELGFTPSLQPQMPVPADIQFKPITVPFSPYNCMVDKTNPRMHGAYVRRTIDLPADAVGKTWRLTVTQVVDEATVYVNGVKVGNVRGGGTPLVADMTMAVKPGKNEIVLLVRDLLAIMDQDYVNKSNPIPSVSYLDAPGIGGSCGLGVGDVRMDASPSLAASELLIVTSVRKKNISARLNLTNHLDRAVHAGVKATVLDEGKPVFELGRQDLSLDKDQSAPLKFEKDWADAKLWGPGSPQLYVLAIEVTDLDNKVVADLACERFGFRESWIQKDHIFFNGASVKLKGGGYPCGAGIDINLCRGAPLPDYFDEWGTMCDEALADVTNSSSKHNVEREAFWDAARKNCLAAAKELQNHPSILAWDLSNEWLSFLGYSGGDGLLGARQLKSMTDVLAQQDPTRWTFYDGDEDLCGLHYNYASHYMMEGANGNPVRDFGHNAYMTQAGQRLKPAGDKVPPMMVSSYLPDGAFWRSLDHDFKDGEVVQVHFTGKQFTYGSKVIMNTENLWKVDAYMPPGLSKFIGEDDVVSDAYDTGSGPVVWMWKQNMDAHRDLGTSYIGPYGRIPGVLRRGYATQCFIMPDTIQHGFAGRKFSRRFEVLNDALHPAKMAIKWALQGADGKAVPSGLFGKISGSKDYDMTSGDLRRDELSFTLPDVKQRTKCTLDLRLEDSGVLVYGEQQDIEVWPDAKIPLAMKEHARQIYLYDPKGKTSELLKTLGMEFGEIASLNLPARGPYRPENMLIVLGEDALTAENAGSVGGQVSELVNSGARVLILAQSVTPGGLPANTKLEPREWDSQLFVRVSTHPVLSGVTSADLHFWAPDRVISRGAYTKPESGAATPLVDSGTSTGLEWTQLMELYRGKGLYLLCQIPVVASYNDEPMAREMFARVVRYAASEQSFRQPVGKLKVFSTPESPLIKSLDAAGVANEVLLPTAKVDASSTVLLDASCLQSAIRNPQSAIVAGWAQALAEGATVVVSGASPADAAWLTQLAGGKSVQFTAAPYLMWEGRGYRMCNDPAVAGLSQNDFYYKRFAGNEGATGQAVDAKLTIEPLQDWAVSVGQPDHLESQEVVFPGALVNAKVGKGTLYIDQRRWMTANEALTKVAQRNLCSLAMGLGVNVAPAVSIRELPRDITYRPVDLSAFANRSLADETPDDGVGGWTDQGKTGDLRTFPTGTNNFAGVPFHVPASPGGPKDTDRSIIVLSSNDRPGADKLPTEVTIPLGQKLEGLCFMHSCAYSGNGTMVGLYQVQYADGSKTDIPLYADVNIRDWVGTASPLPREKGTSSAVAWTGSCKMFPNIAVYRMTWVNPRPDAPIKALRFAHPSRQGVPVLIGLTTIVAADQKTAALAAEKARELLTKALAAVQANDLKTAKDLLQQALKADATLAAAHQAMGDIAERSGDEKAALEVYRAWAAAGAGTPLPYNRIGQILEKQKDYKGALEAYTRSLKIEWNQPPIIEAKERLEAKLHIAD